MVMGMQVFGRAYDIFTARNLEDFESKSWFDCMHGATDCACVHQIRMVHDTLYLTHRLQSTLSDQGGVGIAQVSCRLASIW